jgi:hypothetical protein
MEKAKGARGNSSNQFQKEMPSHDPRAPKTLSELGITYDQSSEWQKLAKVDDAAFDAAFAGTPRAEFTITNRTFNNGKSRVPHTHHIMGDFGDRRLGLSLIRRRPRRDMRQ